MTEDFLRLQAIDPKGAWQQANHNEMVKNWINEISFTLQKFGEHLGYNEGLEFYNDLAWGGLTNTSVFKAKELNERNRINTIIFSEILGSYEGANAKGKKACN
uniref:hypothetical protein n=2 Tax=Roseivirga sp. TaxID=1964215 RepID=UPI004047CE88